MKAKATIERQIRKLRALIETTDDIPEKRIAFAMETTLMWVLVGRTQGWTPMDATAKQEAGFLKKELGKEAK